MGAVHRQLTRISPNNEIPTPVPTVLVEPTPIGEVEVFAIINEFLWGTAQTCDLTSGGSGGSTDLAFNDTTDSCAGNTTSYYMSRSPILTGDGSITGNGNNWVPTSPDPLPSNKDTPPFYGGTWGWDYNYQYSTNNPLNQSRDWSQHDWCMTCHWDRHNDTRDGCEGCHTHGTGLKW
ncbi:MAG: hypothetical protein IZT55_06715 [Anaerolineae bacterium]|nr:hypothetical protein [Anaerolineae bacterium]